MLLVGDDAPLSGRDLVVPRCLIADVGLDGRQVSDGKAFFEAVHRVVVRPRPWLNTVVALRQNQHHHSCRRLRTYHGRAVRLRLMTAYLHDGALRELRVRMGCEHDNVPYLSKISVNNKFTGQCYYRRPTLNVQRSEEVTAGGGVTGVRPINVSR